MKLFATRVGKLTILCVFALLGLGFLAPLHQQEHPALPQGGIVGGMGGSTTATEPQGSVCTATANNPLSNMSVGTLLSGFNVADLVTSLFVTAAEGPINAACSASTSVVTWADSQSFVFSTGSGVTYLQPTVMKFYDASQTIALAAVALLMTLAGFEIMGGASVSTVLPRVILALIAVFAAKPLIGYLVDLESAMCNYALLNATVQTSGEQLNIITLFTAGSSSQLNLSTGINWIGILFIVFMGVAVVIQNIVRLGILDVLIAIAPICLMTYGKRGWQRWGNLWMSAFIATLFVQFVQVVAIGIGSDLIGSLGGPAPLSLLAGIAILYLVFKIPGWMSNAVAGTLAGVPSTYEVLGNMVKQAAGTVLEVVSAVA